MFIQVFMDSLDLRPIFIVVQRSISLMGILVIASGIVIAVYQYVRYFFKIHSDTEGLTINGIRLDLARTLILGLEFIVAADLIGTTTTPDYYSLGILASIVLIRTFLNFTLNRELMSLSKK